MKTFLFFCSLFIYIACISQEDQRKQLQFLIADSRNYFEKSIDTVAYISGKDTTYTSKVGLDGKFSGSISRKTEGLKWANYSIFLLEDTSLKDARKAAILWMDIVKSVAPSYLEEVNEGKRKNIHNQPEYEFLFTKAEAGKRSWISVLYAKDKKSYYLYLSIGWQEASN